MDIIQEIRDRKAVIITVSIVLLAALVIIWQQVQPSSLKVNHSDYRSVGQVLAEEASTLASHSGPLWRSLIRAMSLPAPC